MLIHPIVRRPFSARPVLGGPVIGVIVIATLIPGAFARATDAVLVRTDHALTPYERTMDHSLPALARIQAHLRAVEEDLRATTPVGLSELQRAERARLIDHLGKYWRAGVFPVNDFLPERTPVFIDRVGTHCAVGELMRVSGGSALARDIAERTNFATVRELATREDVVSWATRVGLAPAECARIQPTYCFGGPPSEITLDIQGTTLTATWVNNDDYYNVHIQIYEPLPTIELVRSLVLPAFTTSATIEALPPGNFEFHIFGDCGGFGGPFPPPISFTISPPTYTRGDTNTDGLVNVADVIRTLGWLFAGQAPLACLDAGDTNRDGSLNIADAIYMVSHLFSAGPPPAQPFPTCADDAEPLMGCEGSTTCP